jgi:hypothetical protein
MEHETKTGLLHALVSREWDFDIPRFRSVEKPLPTTAK